MSRDEARREARSLMVPLSRGLAVVVLLTGIVLRFLYIDADPYYYEWVGYITDEGRWNTHARGFALFGRTFETGWPLHLMLAPLYQLSNYVIFSLSTISLTTSRLLSATAGSALLVTFWLLMRRVASPPAVLVGLTLLALEIDILVLSRLALPEMVVMALQLHVYALVVAAPGSLGRLALGGVLQAVAVGMKATALPVVAIFLVLILAEPAVSGGRGRLRSAGVFAAGFALPLVVGALAWSLCCYPRGIDLATLDTILRRVQLSSAYSAFSFFFEDSLAPIMNSWAVALWLGIVGWTSSEDVDPRLRRYLRTAAIWWVTYSIMMLGLLYFPNRYKIHVFVPMAIGIAAGLTLFERAGLAGVDAALARGRGLAGALRVGLIALPTAVFLAPLLADGVGWLAASPPRLRLKVLCVAAALAVTAGIVNHRRRRGLPNIFFVTFPVVTTIAWWALRWTPFDASQLWPSRSSSAHAGWWAGFLLATALITVLINGAATRAGVLGGTRLIVTGAIAGIVLSIASIAPGYVEPHYSIREASRHLGEMFSGYRGVVWTLKAEALFNENALRYVSMGADPVWNGTRPEVFVTVFDLPDSGGTLEREYCLVARYPLYLSPQFFRSHPELAVSPGTVVSARVYRHGLAGCPAVARKP